MDNLAHQHRIGVLDMLHGIAGRPVRSVLLSLSAFVARSAAAQDPFGGQIVGGYAPPARDLPGTILGIINFVLILVGILALAFLVYGGFRYIASRGEDDEVEAAKNIITNAVIGIVVIGVAAALINFVIGAILVGSA